MEKNNLNSILVSVLGLLLIIVSMAGCQSKKAVDLTEEKIEHATLAVKEEGIYQSGVTSSFEEDYYSVDRLRAYVGEQIEEYKKEHPGAGIEITKVEAQDNKAYVVLTFTSLDDYAGFNKVEARQGSVQQFASTEGWPQEFTSAKKGGNAPASQLKAEDKVIIINPHIEATDVMIEGEILYAAGGILLNDNTVQIESGVTGYIVYKTKK